MSTVVDISVQRVKLYFSMMSAPSFSRLYGNVGRSNILSLHTSEDIYHVHCLYYIYYFYCHLSCDATRGTPGYNVPRDLQRHLVNVAAICVAAGFDIERCFTNSP